MTVTKERAHEAAIEIWALCEQVWFADAVDREDAIEVIAGIVLAADVAEVAVPDKHVEAVILAQVQCLAPDILDGALAYLQSDDGKRVELIVPYDNMRAVGVAAALESVPGVTARARRFPLGSVIEVSGSVDAVRYKHLPEDER